MAVQVQATTLSVLVTRPEPFNHELCHLIEQSERCPCHVVSLPTTKLILEPFSEQFKTYMLDVDRYAGIVVVSQQAAHWLVEKIDEFWPQLPVGLCCYAVGASTAEILSNAGLDVCFPESGFDSESLLSMSRLQADRVDAEQWLLVKGVGGRKTICDTLLARGAQLTEAEVYRREKTCPSAKVLQSLEALSAHSLMTLVTSKDILDNFLDIVSFSPDLLSKVLASPIIVVSNRLAHHAQARGFSQPVLAGGPTNAALLKTLEGLINE